MNVFGTPLKRQSPTKLKASPKKKQRQTDVSSGHEGGFSIFQDPIDYRDEKAGLAPQLQQLMLDDDKENGVMMDVSALERKRSLPLDDLTITSHPGFISIGDDEGPLGEKKQLRDPWYSNKMERSYRGRERLPIPSFVTPPKRDRVKSYKFVQSVDKVQRSLDEVIEKAPVDDLVLEDDTVKRQLDFIHSDLID